MKPKKNNEIMRLDLAFTGRGWLKVGKQRGPVRFHFTAQPP